MDGKCRENCGLNFKDKGDFLRVVEIFERGIFEVLTYLEFPTSHQRYVKDT